MIKYFAILQRNLNNQLELPIQFLMGFPDVSVVKESACQCRRWRFDPRDGKISWRKKWQPTPEFLPGESHGQRNLLGYSPQGCKVRHS